MKNKYVFVAAMLFGILLAGIGLTSLYVRVERAGEEDGFKVITSFYPMYIAAENIIGDCEGVILENLSEPQTGCMHDYQLTTQDMAKLSTADVFVVNGGGMEAFLSDVARQYPALTILHACDKIELLEENAHAWMSIPKYMVQVQTIADGLAALDTDHAAIYQQHCTEYLEKLQNLLQRQETIKKNYAGQRVVIFHEALAYIVKECGFVVSGSMDLDEERQVSAGEVAKIVSEIQDHGVTMILAEELYGKEICETVQKEIKVETVYLDTCLRGSYNANSYEQAMEKNLALIEDVLLNIQ